MLSKDAVLKLISKYKTKNPDVEIKLSTGQNMTKEEFEALLAEA
jgi:biotin synthase-like enzyme